MDKKNRRIILLILLVISFFAIYDEVNKSKVTKESIKVEEVKEDKIEEEKYSEPAEYRLTKKINYDLSKMAPKNDLCGTLEQCKELGDVYLEHLLYIADQEKMRKIEPTQEGDKISDMESRKILGLLDILENDELSEIDFDITDKQLANLKEVYETFVKMVPRKWREDVTVVEVYENNFSAAYVNAIGDKFEEQLLGINVDDVNESKFGIVSVLVHELGHIFSLNKAQYIDTDCEEEVYGNSLECFIEDSYLNQFYKAFYLDIPQDWRNNDNKSEKDFNKFYELNQENYVDTYAVNNLYEDFAESFRLFVSDYFPEDENPYDNKILFFYQYPELVLLRTELIKNIVDNDLVGKWQD